MRVSVTLFDSWELKPGDTSAQSSKAMLKSPPSPALTSPALPNVNSVLVSDLN